MKTYHGSKRLKQLLISEALKSESLDAVVRGVYWDGRRGCSVGCLLKDPDGGHEQYPDRFGIPTWVARLQDVLFEGMSYEKSRTWTSEFLRSIPVGVNLDESSGTFMAGVFDTFLEVLSVLHPDGIPDCLEGLVSRVYDVIHGEDSEIDKVWAYVNKEFPANPYLGKYLSPINRILQFKRCPASVVYVLDWLQSKANEEGLDNVYDTTADLLLEIFRGLR